MKYYFEYPDSENCYAEDFFKDEMRENGITEMVLYPAKMVKRESYFYCNEFSEVGEVGESCGNLCGKYEPRNGKNGRCRHHRNCYEPSETPITIKVKP
jgi:hypothetical protein